MISNKNQPSKLSYFYNVGLFIIGTTLFFAKFDSKDNIVKPVQYAGLICILSSSLSIFVGLITWIREIPFADDKTIEADTISNKRFTPPNSESENEKDISTFNHEETIENNSSQSTRKSHSAPATTDCPKKLSN